MLEHDLVKAYGEILPTVLASLVRRLIELKVHDNIEQLAEDIAEDALERSLKMWRQGGIDNPKNLIWFMVKASYFKFLKSKVQLGIVDIDTYRDSFIAEDTDPAQSMISEEECAAIYRKLTPSQKKAVELLNKGFEYKDVRENLNLKPGSFRNLMSAIHHLFNY